MFQLTLLLLANLFAPGSSAPVDTASCTNSKGGSCSIASWAAGRAKFRTSRSVGTVRFDAPASSKVPDWSIVFDGAVTEDCEAEQTCPNGAKISCSAVGTNTQCQSNATSVGCLTVGNDGQGTSGSSATCQGS